MFSIQKLSPVLSSRSLFLADRLAPILISVPLPGGCVSQQLEQAMERASEAPEERNERWLTESITTLKENPDTRKRIDAATHLRHKKDSRAVMALADRLSDKELSANAEPALRLALDNPSPGVRTQVAGALESIGVAPKELVNARLYGLKGKKLHDRAVSLRGLAGHVDNKLLLPVAMKVAEHDADKQIAYSWLSEEYASPDQVLKSLVDTGDRELIKPFMTAVKKKHPGDKYFLWALGRYSPKPKGWTDILLGQLESGRMIKKVTR